MTKLSVNSTQTTKGKVAIDLERYVPAYLSWIANKLSRGASQHYLNTFGVGIETWRCLVLLAQSGSMSAQYASRVIGMDKGSISRCLKSMQEDGLIRTKLDPNDGRAKIAVLTGKGRALHDKILGVALERERVLVSILTPKEIDLFIEILHRLHANLPAVEIATQAYLTSIFPSAAKRCRTFNSTPDLS